MLDRKTAIARAKEILNDYKLGAEFRVTLQRHKSVRVPVLVKASTGPFEQQGVDLDADQSPPVVIFTEEDCGGFGLCLMAEYMGVKEFAA